jgi:hypothetical protein
MTRTLICLLGLTLVALSAAPAPVSAAGAAALPVEADRLQDVDRLGVRVAGALFGRAAVVGRELATGGNQRPGLLRLLARQANPPPIAAVIDENAAWNSAPASH